MILRMATLTCVLALFSSSAAAQIWNGQPGAPGRKAWYVRYEPGDLPGFPFAARLDTKIRIQIVLQQNGNPQTAAHYRVHVTRELAAGGSQTFSPLNVERVAVGFGGRRRMALKTVEHIYPPAGGGMNRSFTLFAIWHPGIGSGREDDTLQVRIIDKPVGTLRTGDCEEEPDTDVLEETDDPGP
jgi:hypothetical protein